MLYIFFSIIIACFSFKLFQKAAGSLSVLHLNVLSYIFFVHIVLETFIGVNLAILNLDDHYLINLVRSEEVKNLTYFAVCYVMLVMPLTMVALNKMCGFSPQEALESYQIRISYHNYKKYPIVTMMFFLSICAGAIIYTYWQLKEVPMINFFLGQIDEMQYSRIASARAFAGIEYVKNIFAMGLTPIICYCAYCYKKIYQNALSNIVFFVLLFLSCIIVFLNSEKAPILILGIGLLIIKSLYEKVISKKTFVTTVLLMVLVILGMYIMINQTDAIFYINQGPIGRLLLGQVAGLFLSFHLFPEQYGFLWGASFPAWIVNLFDVEHVRSANLIMETVNPSGKAAGIAGVINTLFIGEAWANFGWVGFIFSPIIVGIVIQTSNILWMKLPPNPIFIALFVYLGVQWPVTGGFIDFIYNVNYFSSFILCMIFYYFSRYEVGEKK